MTHVADLPSIFDVPPLEAGGVEARVGLALQDHVAVSYLLQMLRQAELQQVWCETEDDITLLWGDGDKLDYVEFVQVKGENPGQFWSVSTLCQRDRQRPGTSVLEKSLAHDRCKEDSRFRLVTAVDVNADLQLLKLPIGHPRRHDWRALPDAASPGVPPLVWTYVEVARRVSDFSSRKRNAWDYWLDNMEWAVPGDADAVRSANTIQLIGILEDAGEYLATDQRDELYAKLLRKAMDAAQATLDRRPDKLISREALRRWFDTAVSEVQNLGVSIGGESPLRKKLEHAGLSDYFDTARLLRERYRRERLQPKYLQLDEWKDMEGAVSAALNRLKSDLDARVAEDDGPKFHALCIETLTELRQQLDMSSPHVDAVLQGCMYDMANRCSHRFRRVTA